jgi:hypothetical protein
MWVTVSAGVTIVAYGFLFLGTIITAIRKTPRFFLSLNSRRVSAGAMRWSRILVLEVLPWMALVVFIFGCWAGMGVGFWKFYTSKLSKGAKVGISFAIFGPMSVVSLVRNYYTLRPRTRGDAQAITIQQVLSPI